MVYKARPIVHRSHPPSFNAIILELSSRSFAYFLLISLWFVVTLAYFIFIVSYAVVIISPWLFKLERIKKIEAQNETFYRVLSLRRSIFTSLYSIPVHLFCSDHSVLPALVHRFRWIVWFSVNETRGLNERIDYGMWITVQMRCRNEILLINLLQRSLNLLCTVGRFDKFFLKSFRFRNATWNLYVVKVVLYI